MFKEAAEQAARRGIVVQTGATSGSEQSAVEVALAAGGSVHLYLPWKEFEAVWRRGLEAKFGNRVETTVYDSERDAEWTAAIAAWHPHGEYLARASMALYARNHGLVTGSDLVVALPFVRVRKGETEKGPTEQGIELARERGIPLYDLSEIQDRDRMEDWLDIEPD